MILLSTMILLTNLKQTAKIRTPLKASAGIKLRNDSTKPNVWMRKGIFNTGTDLLPSALGFSAMCSDHLVNQTQYLSTIDQPGLAI